MEQRPDVTLMDLDLPGRAAIATIRKIRELHPGARIAALAAYEPDATWTEALNAGAYQCVAKDDLDGFPHPIPAPRTPANRKLPENRERSIPIFRDFPAPGFGNGLSAGQSLKCEEQLPLLGWLERETNMSRKDKRT